MRAGRFTIASSIVVGAVALGATARFAATSFGPAVRAGQTNSAGQTMLPSGWAVTPAGRHIPLKGDMPLAMCLTPDGARLAVVTGGWHDQGLTLVDVASEQPGGYLGLTNSWAGLAISGDTCYVSGGSKPVRTVKISGSDLERQGDLAIVPPKGWTSGIAYSNGVLYAADVNKGMIAHYDTAKGQLFEVGVEGHPYGVAVSPDGKTVAVSEWGRARVTLRDPSMLRPIAEVEVGSHPNALAFGPDGRLFVACAGTNSVSVIRGKSVVETIRTSMQAQDPVGSTPDAVAVSPDGKTLYVANADNNDVAVVDISGRESAVRGFIPTGWYPSALAVSADGKKLFIGTGKGLRFEANGFVKDGKPAFKYIDSLLSGTLSVVDAPTDAKLADYTAQVMRNAPAPTGMRLARDDSSVLRGALKKIKHVLYIIRENRTYDQVFGDMPRGNNDPSLVMYGQEVTPNAHALANRYVLLDNTYCNGEVSEDGHQWCNSAYASDFVERAYVNSYSGRGEPDGEGGIADSPGGYLWDNCRKHGKTFRSYGEFANFTSTPEAPPKFTGIGGLEGHACLAWSQFHKRGDRDYDRVSVFIDELHDAEKTGVWPEFMVMSLGEDHTSGLRPGSHTPNASVGSNDLALGRLVEAISHSKFWKESAIFVIEDDAQNGPDHVDAHRTEALVISPYVKLKTLDSTMYTTSSLVKTMELILGLPPMTQYDQRATPMFASFTAKPDFTPYDAITPTIDLEAMNPDRGALAEASKKLDWSHYDAANPDKLNAILWQAAKGPAPMPAPVRSSPLALQR